MNGLLRWSVGGAVATSLMSLLLVGCGHKAGLDTGDDNGSSSGGSTADDSGGDDTPSTGDDNGPVFQTPDGGGLQGAGDTRCKAGFYLGQFGGLYSSSVTIIGINIPVVGDVRLTLKSKGSDQQMCTFEGETTKCSDIFSLENGTISGMADMAFPYYCDMTGTLSCQKKTLENGWIQCHYCAFGVIPDGGGPCVGIGGKFAGPLKVDYFYTGGADGGSTRPSFGTVPPPLLAPDPSKYDPGTWNGAESLAGYPGTGPLPDGGTLYDYLSDAGYGIAPHYGGTGWWFAEYSHP
jgi:hypothetical protein